MPGPSPDFAPGLRFSLSDGVCLVLGGALVSWLLPLSRPMALLTLLVIGHFFLFCNVFRIGRKQELLWASVFVSLVASSLFIGIPSLGVAAGLSVLLGASLILYEMRLPRYHGIFWQQINPNLSEWWQTRQAAKPGPGSGIS